MTAEELTIAFAQLSGQIDLLPTQDDMTNLLNSIITRHQALLSAISALESRLTKIEDAHLSHATNDTRHN